MWRIWLRRIAIAVVGVFLAFVFGFVPYFLINVFCFSGFKMPDKENAGLTPASFKLAYEDVSFQAKDGVSLSGWWVPAESARGTVVLVHGLNRSRIEMVGKVPFLHELGWNALLFDLRFHGDSGGKMRSLGFFEQADVRAAADLARQRSPGPVVLWGISVGGATVVFTAADDPQVAGVVCDSSYRSLRDTTSHHLALFRQFRWWLRLVPVWPVSDEALFWFERRTGVDPDTLDVVKAAARLRGRPALFVANSEDRRMPKEIAFELQAAAGPQAEVLIVPGKSHGGAWRDGTAAYEAAAKVVLAAAAGNATLPVAAQ
jgi:pimeloyl-ACP methyl ester carboxylesterase